MKKLIILSLLICLSFTLNSHISPEIKKAIRKSHPDTLRLLLKEHNLNEVEKADLLALAEEVFKINQSQFNDQKSNYKELYRRKKRMKNLKFGLAAIFGSVFGLGSIVYARKALTQSMQSADFLENICMCPVFAVSSFLLIKYAIHSLNRIRNSRSRKEKYLDSKEVHQILS